MLDDGVLDEAFERFAKTGPEFGLGLSNHGPRESGVTKCQFAIC